MRARGWARGCLARTTGLQPWLPERDIAAAAPACERWADGVPPVPTSRRRAKPVRFPRTPLKASPRPARLQRNCAHGGLCGGGGRSSGRVPLAAPSRSGRAHAAPPAPVAWRAEPVRSERPGVPPPSRSLRGLAPGRAPLAGPTVPTLLEECPLLTFSGNLVFGPGTFFFFFNLSLKFPLKI